MEDDEMNSIDMTSDMRIEYLNKIGRVRIILNKGIHSSLQLTGLIAKLMKIKQ